MESVTKIVQEMVMNCGLPLKVIASRIGKPYPTLLRELNPYDKGAKLGVETLLEIMKVVKNTAPLEYLAEEMGRTLAPNQHIPKPKINGQDKARSASRHEDRSDKRENQIIFI